ncbi:MAG: hypothetical protein E7166_05055 [Firmicutes bacterium]|nr:hypothetical protein [Bacillota bacterium]
MKVRNIVYTLILILSCFFMFDMDVNAEESYAKCWYSVTGDKDMSGQNHFSVYVETKNNKVNYKVLSKINVWAVVED